MMKIGEKIRILRKESHLTQTELAKSIFTSQDTLSLWELGKSLPDIESVVKIAQIFDVSTDYLLGLEKWFQ